MNRASIHPDLVLLCWKLVVPYWVPPWMNAFDGVCVHVDFHDPLRRHAFYAWICVRSLRGLGLSRICGGGDVFCYDLLIGPDANCDLSGDLVYYRNL